MLLTCTYVAINPTLNLRIVNSEFICDLSNSSDERLHPALTQAFPIMSLCLSSLNNLVLSIFLLPPLLLLACWCYIVRIEHAKVQSVYISASSMWWPYHYMRKYEQILNKKEEEEEAHQIQMTQLAMLCCGDQAIFQALEMPQRPDNKLLHAGKQFG